MARKIRGCTEFIREAHDRTQVANAYYNRGNAYSAKSDHARAIADYSKAIQIDPKHAHAYHNRGRAYWVKRNYDQAIADQTKAAEITKSTAIKAHAYYNLGVVFRDKSEPDRAIAFYTRAIELKTGETEVNFRAYLNRAAAHMIKMNYEDTIADLSKAIAISPNRTMSLYRKRSISYATFDPYGDRAWAYFKAGKAAQGLPDANRSLALRADNARTLATRGHIHEALSRREDAIADFRRALSLAPSDQELLASTKEALKRLGAEP